MTPAANTGISICPRLMTKMVETSKKIAKETACGFGRTRRNQSLIQSRIFFIASRPLWCLFFCLSGHKVPSPSYSQMALKAQISGLLALFKGLVVERCSSGVNTSYSA